jgi:peptide/nickel transport system substrate-binding protein
MGGVPAGAFTKLGDDARFFSAAQAGYTAIYLNSTDVLFADAAVRQALSLALDRQTILHDPAGLHDQGVPAVSPIPPGSWAYDGTLPRPDYDPERAQQILESASWIDSDGDGVRDRDGKPLQFALATSSDPLLQAIAKQALANWRAVGISTTLETQDQQQALNALRGRTYQAALFSVGVPLVGNDPDPYPLWHSSQIEGGTKLNFAGFSNAEADGLIDQARQAGPADLAARRALYQKLQRLFVAEQPVLMLYHPVYSYAVADPNLGGVQLPQLIVEPADRFASLADWYVRTERFFNK